MKYFASNNANDAHLGLRVSQMSIVDGPHHLSGFARKLEVPNEHR